MRAITVKDFGGPEQLMLTQRDRPVPSKGQVLIKIASAGVNRPDCFQRMGLYPPPKGASDILGLEVSGTIEAIGEMDAMDFSEINPFGLKVGDPVCALLTGGGYAEYALAPMQTLLPVPKGISLIEAASLPETFFTVWSNIFDRAYFKKGETVLVHGGSSGIGSAAIQLIKAFGGTVITTVGSEDKVHYAYELGADRVVNYKEHDFVGECLAYTSGQGVDIVLDMVGGEYINRNIAAMAPEGRHVSIAFLQGHREQVNFMPVMLKRLTLTGSTLRARDNDFKAAIAQQLYTYVWPLITDGTIRTTLDSILPLADAQIAHEKMEKSLHMGKIILEIG